MAKREFQTIDIEADTTCQGEHAPSITAVLENGTFYLHQTHTERIATVGMSREQARSVRNALNRLLEPTFADRPVTDPTDGGENG